MPQTPDGTAYELTGPEDAPAIVLIHGLGLTRACWNGIAPHLAQHYRVLNYDLCGHGETALPRQKPNLMLLADQLRGLLDETGIETAVLAGFSLGGMINRRFAMDYPARTNGLIILNSPHERGDEQQRLVEERAADSAAAGPAANIETTLARWLTEDFRRHNPDIIAEITATVLANEPANYAAHRWVLANGVIELIRPEPPITVPSLVITCENDSGSTPAMTQAIASEIPGARSLIIPHLQHLGLIEQPQAFVKPMLEFMTEIC